MPFCYIQYSYIGLLVHTHIQGKFIAKSTQGLILLSIVDMNKIERCTAIYQLQLSPDPPKFMSL